MRLPSLPKHRSQPKQAHTQGGSSVSSQSQGRHSHTSTSFMLSTIGSTASTTAVGRLVRPGCWSSSPSGRRPEENTLAAPSLPNRITRLSNTHRPHTSTGRAAPTKASAVTR